MMKYKSTLFGVLCAVVVASLLFGCIRTAPGGGVIEPQQVASGSITFTGTSTGTRTLTSQTTENKVYSAVLSTDSSYIGGSDITYSGGVGSSGYKSAITYTGTAGAVTGIYSSVTTTNTFGTAAGGVMAVKGYAQNTGAMTDGNVYGGQFVAKHNHATNKMANEAPLIGIEGWAYDAGAAPAGTVIGGNFGYHNEGTTAKDSGAVYRGVQIFLDDAAGSAAPSEKTGLAIWNMAGAQDSGIKLIRSGTGFTKDFTLQYGETIDNATDGIIALSGRMTSADALVGGGYLSTGCTATAAGVLKCTDDIASDADLIANTGTLTTTLTAGGLAALNGGIAVDTSVFTVDGTSGQVIMAPVADADTGSYDSLLTIDHALVGLGTKDRVYGLDVEMSRAAGYGTTNGDHDDAGIKVRMVNKATDNTAGTTLRGVDVNVKNDNPGGSITNLSGGVFTSQIDNGAGSTSTVYGLQGSITANDAVTDSSIVADFRTLRQAQPDPTTEYIVQVRNGNTIGTGVDAGLRFLSEAATVGDYGYVIDMNDAAAATADIRLTNGETISNVADGTIATDGALTSTRTLTGQSTENQGLAATLTTDSTYVSGSNITYSSAYGSSAGKFVGTYSGVGGGAANVYSLATNSAAHTTDGAGVMALKAVAVNTAAMTDGNIYGGQFIAKHNHGTNKMANEAPLIGLEGWAYNSGAAPAGTMIGGNFGFHNEGSTAKDAGAVYKGVQVFVDNAAGSAAPSSTVGVDVWNMAGTVDSGLTFTASGSGFTNEITLQNGETINNSSNGIIALGGRATATDAVIGGGYLSTGCTATTAGVLACTDDIKSDADVIANTGTFSTTLATTGDVTINTDATGGNSGAKNELIGLPRIKLASLGAGSNGSTETTLYTAAADPAAAWVVTGSVTLSNDTTYKRVGVNSLKLAFGAAAAVNDGAYQDITNDNLEANESIGFWERSSITLLATDIKLLVDDTGGPDVEFDTCAITTANKWQWCEVNISTLAGGGGDVVDKIAFHLKTDQAAFDFYVDGMYKWDEADEAELNVDIPYDGVLSVVAVLTDETGANTTSDLAEQTAYFVNYQASSDVIVYITDQSANSNLALVAYQ